MLVPGTSDLRPSSPSCTSWSTEFPQRWSRFSAFWPFRRRKRILVLCATSPLTRCNRSWMLPIPAVRDGIRDRAMLHLCFAGGLRVSELVGLRTEDLLLQPQASILVHGKGRKERCLPLWKETASALTRMAGSSGHPPCARTIPQRSQHLHDPRWFRVHPAQACLRGGEAMPIPFRQNESLRMSSATPVRLRFSRPPKICARCRSGSGTQACKPPRFTRVLIRL